MPAEDNEPLGAGNNPAGEVLSMCLQERTPLSVVVPIRAQARKPSPFGRSTMLPSRQQSRSRGVAVVAELPLRRAGTLDFVRLRAHAPARGFDGAADLLAQGPAVLSRLFCVILNVGSRSVAGAANGGPIGQLRRALPDGVAIVVLSDREEIEEIVAAFHYGARGFIPSSFEPEVASEALGIVLAGGTFFPASALLRLRRAGPRLATDRQKPEACRKSDHWPPRQLAVLKLLVQGKVNKEIAHELGIEESTVKIHVWHLMRRLGVSNRTQAALRTRQLGILGHEPGREPRAVAEHAAAA